MGANLIFKSFNYKTKLKDQKKLSKYLNKIIQLEWPEFFKSFKKNYKYTYDKKIIQKYKAIKNINIIGMGGSSLGTKAIYNFLIQKIKKNVSFYENVNLKKESKTKALNIIISKSGNTLETIVNFNTIYNNKNKNIFITEKTNNYLQKLANKLKSNVIEHKNFIGGRFSVLSEVGMLPAQLMGLNERKFKNYNNLIIKKKFLNILIHNVLSTYQYVKAKKFNSVILNYDPKSEDLFKWYQQLISESLGKNSKGILPIISTMPKDNHSLMQLYLDGPKNNFFTFFSVNEKKSEKIINSKLLKSYSYLKNKSFGFILNSQKLASEKVFLKKNIPFRSFEILRRNEETLGELFTFFILETILVSKSLGLNPYNQPAVELIKIETKKKLIG